MTKRIFAIVLTIQFLIFGGSSAWADSSNSSESTQEIVVSVGQEQTIDTSETDDEMDNTQDHPTAEASVEGDAEDNDEGNTNETEDEQGTSTDEDPNATNLVNNIDNNNLNKQNAEVINEQIEITNDENSIQDQIINGDIEQDQQQDKTSEQMNADQEQTIEITAEQKQEVINAEKVEAHQGQDVTVEYSQSLKVNKRDKQSQDSTIVTEQDQSIITPDATDLVVQTMEATIEAKQVGEINPKDRINTTKEETAVETIVHHESETSGDVTIQQSQSVEGDASKKDKSTDSLTIKAAVENGVTIVKNAADNVKESAKTVVTVVQSIFINDEKVADINEEFVLEDGVINKEQTYSKTYSWGTLYVLNSVNVSHSEDQDVNSNLKSIIRLEYILQNLPKVQVDVEDDSCLNDSDCDGLTDDEERLLGTDPYNPDTDGDGLTDYQEVRIYFTDPLNPDSGSIHNSNGNKKIITTKVTMNQSQN